MSIASTLKRTMATAPNDSRKLLEGVFAVNKPQWASSAGVLRDLQHHFAKSALFQPWLDAQRREMIVSLSKQKHVDRLKVKLGHGGTLDPMATGVLIVGVGKGTKCLQRFLECTKTYECVVLFGAATDSYDAVGKVVSKASYHHVTKELVEEKLAQFRGKILQKPSVFSALKVDGKKMYEYAREGKNIPEVAARPVEVLEMDLVEWLEPGAHEYTWPREEADGAEREGAEKLLGIRREDANTHAKNASRGQKRPRTLDGDEVENAGQQPKRPRTDSEQTMSGALPSEEAPGNATTHTADEEQAPEPVTGVSEVPGEKPAETVEQASEMHIDGLATGLTENQPTHDSAPSIQPPAARLRMTVTSGFYVRSLCHDLGLACSSLGLMSSLVRSRQGDYTLDQNVVEFSEFEKGPEVWEPQVQKQLEEFMDKEGWQAKELEDDDAWEEKKGELMKRRREDDQEISYKGGHKWKGKGNWRGKGKGGRNSYSKTMDGGRD
ncbi:pseudouridine synthase [Ampelomyces quisqualis]|uniref:tRNA pseudouridine(55) synthase n=1 Tax=Ampelomyces quisqualis TaxID=50730 RepID=A0A6A5R332_AMPQU|nr:pseudouridine synthase [Ampelomyces quisqualis]